MTPEQKQIQIIAKIKQLTENGSLTWTPDAEADSFSTTLSPGYIARSKWPNDLAVLEVLNAEGYEIFSERESMDEPPKGIVPIWHAARSSALGIDKALDEILKSLQ